MEQSPWRQAAEQWRETSQGQWREAAGRWRPEEGRREPRRVEELRSGRRWAGKCALSEVHRAGGDQRTERGPQVPALQGPGKEAPRGEE